MGRTEMNPEVVKILRFGPEQLEMTPEQAMAHELGHLYGNWTGKGDQSLIWENAMRGNATIRSEH
jgi:hypothetical protein